MQQRKSPHPGCGHNMAIAAILIWFLSAPLAAALLAGGINATALAIAAPLWVAPLVGIARLAGGREGWKRAAAISASLAAAAGYLILMATWRVLLPSDLTATLARTRWHPTILLFGPRLVVFGLYALLAAWSLPRLAGVAQRPLREWLGLDRLVPSTLLLGLATAALVTLPWPVTGALGDRFNSLATALHALAWTVPQILVLWGVAWGLFNATFTHPTLAALATIALHGLVIGGQIATGIGWGALPLLGLILLLAELRAREGGTWPLLPVAWAYYSAPLLFTDPRDAIAIGSPLPPHLLAYGAAMGVAMGWAVLLWVGRRLMPYLSEGSSLSDGVRIGTAGICLLLLGSGWIGLYLGPGQPGFADDGFLIILEEQADLSAAPEIADRQERLQYVYDTLVATAERTQAPLRVELEEMGLPYRSYYLINMIRVEGHHLRMGRFENWPGVAQVILNPNVRSYPVSTDIPYPEAPPNPTTDPLESKAPSNLAAMHADEAWALGATGEGIVVAGQDTGVDWTHPALYNHYRGQGGEVDTHDYNWHDAWDGTAVPHDDDSHGTHTLGIVVGDDGAENRIGVAPDARWIACRNMRRGIGNPGSYVECMEFFLAPYPIGGDPFHSGEVERAPHVVNNSWGCPEIEGCLPDTLRPAVEALRAAGIMMVVSAGNDGPACNTVTTPPANYDAVVSVGATNNEGQVASFSSRGPTDGRIKPDLAAPGVAVRSSVPGGGYAYADGTSMAGPHVAGLVALLWSVEPHLIGQIDATEALICQTAAPQSVTNRCTAAHQVPDDPLASLRMNPICACGGTTGSPNNIYGCGLIDAAAAVRSVIGGE